MADEAQNPLPQEARERYKLLELLGCGGKGQVYVAEDTQLGRPVALKVINPELAQDRRERHRFKREILAIANLKHPNIVQLYDFADTDGVMFYTMELLEGRSFQDVIQTDDLTIVEAVEMVRQVAKGVAAIHQTGVFHRDLKPGNIVITDDGGIKVIDFGAVKDAVDGNMTAITMRGHVVGTVLYQPPEAFSASDYDARSDVYQLGLILYEALTGCHPLENYLISDIIGGQAHNTLSPPSSVCAGLSPVLDQLVMCCLSADKEQRPKDAQAFANELQNWLGSASQPQEEEEEDTSFEVSFTDAQRSALLRKRKKRKMKDRLLAACLFLLIVLSALGAYHFIRSLRQKHYAATDTIEPVPVTPKADGELLKAASVAFKRGDGSKLQEELGSLSGPAKEISQLALAILKRDSRMALQWGQKPASLHGDFARRRDVFDRLPLMKLALAAPRNFSDNAFGNSFAALSGLSSNEHGAKDALREFIAPFYSYDEPSRRVFANPPKGGIKKGVLAASNYHRFFAAASGLFFHQYLQEMKSAEIRSLVTLLYEASFVAWNNDEYLRRFQATMEQWRQALTERQEKSSLGAYIGSIQMMALATPLAAPLKLSEVKATTIDEVTLFYRAMSSFARAYRHLLAGKDDNESVAKDFSTAIRLFRRYSKERNEGNFVDEAQLYLGRSLGYLACALEEKTYQRISRAHIRQPSVLPSGAVSQAALKVLNNSMKTAGKESVRRQAAFHFAYWLWRTNGRATEGFRQFQSLLDKEREEPLLRLHLTLSIRTFTATPP